jgi:hypothetical protein
MPGDGGYGRLVLLDVFADPPVVVILEIANRYALGTACYGELLF